MSSHACHFCRVPDNLIELSVVLPESWVESSRVELWANSVVRNSVAVAGELSRLGVT